MFETTNILFQAKKSIKKWLFCGRFFFHFNFKILLFLMLSKRVLNETRQKESFIIDCEEENKIALGFGW